MATITPWTEEDIKAIIALKKKAIERMMFSQASDLRSLEKYITVSMKKEWTESLLDKAINGGDETTGISEAKK